MSDNNERIDSLSPLKRALFALEEMKTKLKKVQREKSEPIAIVGMSSRFPGADNNDEYWDILKNGIDTISEVPKDRWDIDSFYDSSPGKRGKIISRYGGFIKQKIDQFDPAFFGISPREAIKMDPQQRLLLEVTWEAFENAGISPKDMSNSRTGVFVGICSNDYGLIQKENQGYSGIDAYTGSGNATSIAANRISYLLDLQGPSLSIDTACSSSLVTVHLACQSLRNGEANMAVAGGVSILLTPEASITFSQANMLAPGGRCRTFDANAEGYVRGEGCGMIVLKRLSDARKDNDNILAVIRGSAVNQDGRTNGLTAPSSITQQRVFQEALDFAKVKADDISYIEAHGTGTSLGDPIEIQALNGAMESRANDDKCYIGSSKTNIGHLEGASGIAGLIKTVLALKHKLIPAHLNFSKINPLIPIDETPFEIPIKTIDWQVKDKKRIAGIHSFGFGGTNAHVILQEAPKQKIEQNKNDRQTHLLCLSAKSKNGLKEIALRFSDFAKKNKNISLADLCSTANRGRLHDEHRLAIKVHDISELIKATEDFAKDKDNIFYTYAKIGNKVKPKIAFLFPGHSEQYSGMAKELYNSQPHFKETIDECNEILKNQINISLLDTLFSSDKEQSNSQLALFVIEYALARLWISWGVKPDFLIGQDIGEYTAAIISNVFSLEDGLRLASASSQDKSTFEKSAKEIENKSPSIQLISSISGEIHEQAPDADFWIKQINNTDNFDTGLKTLAENGCELLLTVGPGNSNQDNDNWLFSIKPNEKDWDVLIDSLAVLYSKGFTIDWQEFESGYNRSKIELPTYPFQRERFWTDPIDGLSSKTISGEFIIEEENDESFNHDELLALPENEQLSFIEEKIVSKLSRIMKIIPSRIDREKPFTQLGLDSIMAIELKNNIEQSMNIELALSALLSGPNIKEISAIVLNELLSDSYDAQRLQSSVIDVNGIDESITSVSHGQQAMWFQHQLSPSSIYNLVYAARIPSQLDVKKLRVVMSILVQRHESLRTNFVAVDGKPQLVVHKEGPSIFQEIDTTDLNDIEFQKRLKAEISKPYDLENDTLTRVVLFTRPDGSQILFYGAHHIISDMWSLAIFMYELNEIYSASENLLFAESGFTAIQHARQMNYKLAGQFGERHFNYWKTKLSGDLPILNFPTDKPRPAIQTYNGLTETIQIDREIQSKLEKIAEENSTTLYTLLLAAFKILLFRYSGQSDLVIGTPTTGRTSTEYSGVLGYFVNPVAIRSSIDGNSPFLEYLSQIKKAVFEALDHQDYPFNLLVEKIQPQRDPSRSPVFQMMFVYQRSHLLHDSGMSEAAVFEGSSQMKLGDIILETMPINDRVVPFDMTMLMAEIENGLGVSLSYNTDLFEAKSVLILLEQFKRLLKAISENPEGGVSSYPLLSPEEEKTILFDRNQTELIYNSCFAANTLFESIVPQFKTKTALHMNGSELNYGELNKRANQVAHALIEQKIGPESIVAISMERSFEMIIAMLGVFKTGAAYLPIDPGYPTERLDYMIQDSDASLLLTQKKLNASFPGDKLSKLFIEDIEVEGKEFNNPKIIVDADNLAYIIYTSGSTGKPKAVMISYASMHNLVQSQIKAFSITDKSRVLQFASFSFDAAVSEIFTTLLSGATLVLIDSETIVSGDGFQDYLREMKITTATIPPSVLRISQPQSLGNLETVISAGESLPVETARTWAENRQMINAYGPSETTVCASLYKFNSLQNEEIIPIGSPLYNTQLYVLDSNMNSVPDGSAGELYIGGLGVARGYLKRPSLTAEKFIPDPFSGKSGARLYRSGDLVRYNKNGLIEFLERIDQQIKIRGFRIELGEIEAIINSSADVENCFVTAVGKSDKTIVAYIISKDKESNKTTEISTLLEDQLPDYMRPSALLMIDEFPLTINNKIDINKLPAPEELRAEYVEPKSKNELQLVSIWQDILKVEKVGTTDNFFNLGGHSLLATQLISRIRNDFGISLPISNIFTYPTIAELSKNLELSLIKNHREKSLSILPVPRAKSIPLSFAQQRLLFLDQLEPGSPLYNICAPLRMKGKLDKKALATTLNEIISRHEILRTVFVTENEQPLQIIKESLELEIKTIQLEKATGDSELEKHIIAESLQPFDLSTGPLIRARQLNISENDSVFILTLHHIISDHWSTGVLIQEIMQLYPLYAKGEKSSLPDLDIQYADFAHWQQEWFKSDSLQTQLNYWEKQLAGVPPLLEMPWDFPRPSYQTYKGDYRTFIIENNILQKIMSISELNDVTPFMTLLSAFQVLLWKYSGQDDFSIGSPIANRNRNEIENLIGFFVNTLVLRANLTDNPTFKELLQRVKKTTLLAYDNQDLPFETLVEKIDPKRDMSHTPLFQVMFVLNNAPVDTLSLPGLELDIIEYENKMAKFDLIFNFNESNAGMDARVEFNTDLYKSETIERMIDHFNMILSQLLSTQDNQISEVSLLSEKEHKRLIEEMAPSKRISYSEKMIPEIIDDIASQHADKTAIIMGDKKVSYQELSEHINSIASYLQNEMHIKGGEVVGVLAGRSPEMIFAMLGVMKANATYLPLDPNYPVDRLKYMIDDSNVRLLLKQGKLEIPAGLGNTQTLSLDSIHKNGRYKDKSEIDSAAYIIYTSGSTGNPKGVLVAHQTIANHCTDMATHFNYSSGKNVLQFAALNFDAALEQILSTLISGCTLVLRDDDLWPVSDFMNYVKKFDLNTINLPTAYWNQLTDHLFENNNPDFSDHNLELVIIGGDTMKIETLKKWNDTLLSGTRLLNAYGPTESVITASTFEVTADSISQATIPIGKPCANRSMYVLDQFGNLVPGGFPGELHIAGDNLAIGYHKLPELTKEKFISNPFSNDESSRMYKTGDKVRINADGNFEFLGRVDEQVKIRGFRIEPSEIEAVLINHPDIRETIVVPRHDVSGEKALFAYYVPQPGANPSISDLRSYLKQRLPEFMVPALFIPLENFALLPSGKVNKRDLPIPDDLRSQLGSEYVAPRNETEEILSQIASDVLKIDKVGVKDNFFELGGHSILATLFISRAREQLHTELPLRTLFENPTVEGIALELVKQQAENQEESELDDMLVQLDNLSDEEVKKLLDEK